MQGGSQWIEWKLESLDCQVAATKKESSTQGPDMPPAFHAHPRPIKDFFKHLDRCGKAR
jgi:hypothetical protein